jgi:hypothetical protein
LWDVFSTAAAVMRTQDPIHGFGKIIDDDPRIQLCSFDHPVAKTVEN